VGSRGIQYLIETSHRNHVTADVVEAARLFMEIPGEDKPRLKRIENYIDAHGNPRAKISTHSQILSAQVRHEDGSIQTERHKVIDARDPELQAAFLAELEKQAISARTREPERFTLDGEEAEKLKFKKHQTDYDVTVTLTGGGTRDFKNLARDELFNVIGEENLARIDARKGDVGVLKDLQPYAGLSPKAINERAQAMAEEQKAFETLSVDLYGENSVERADGLQRSEVLARAAALRAREQDADRTGNKDAKSVETGQSRAQEQDTPTRATATDSQTRTSRFTEQDALQQFEAMARVYTNFKPKGMDFYFRDQSEQLAFRDKGDKIVTRSNDERVALGLVNMAEARGWGAIKVNGHPDFRRNVWMEAALKGIEVRGFVPTEHDKTELQMRQDRSMRNGIEKSVAQRQHVAGALAEKVVGEKIKNPETRELALRKIQQGLQQRANAGHVPGVPMYDKSAPPRQQHQKREKEPARDPERSR
jgi:hypothetical protein